MPRTSILSAPTEESIMANETDFRKDFDSLRADVAALTGTVGKLATVAEKAQVAMSKTVKRAVHNPAGVGEEIWDEVADLGNDSAKAARDAAHMGVSTLENEIKRNPLRSVLVALGVGFIVGMLGHK